MKQFVLLFLAIIFLVLGSHAQVNTIPFTQSMDTFQLINGTVIDAPMEDDIFHADLPLGFSVNYNGNVTSKFGVCTNGFIVMDSANHSSLWTLGTFSVNQVNGMLADLRNSNTGGSIEYVTVGAAPNRVCIIQWKDYGIFAVPYCHLNMQIRIHETSGCIQFYYGNNAYALSTGQLFHVGLTGATTTDFNMRSTNLNWTNSSPALTFSGSGMFLNPLSVVPPGLVFSFGTCPATGIPFSYMSGNVYNDLNGNGVKDAGESGMANVMVHEGLQNYYTTTDNAGNYSLFYIDSSLTYAVHAIPLMYWNITSTPTTYNVTPLTQATNNLDFGLQATPNIHDVTISSNSSNVPWPNANITFYTTYHNNGTVVESGDTIFFVKDSHYSFTSSTPAPDVVSGDSILWVYSNLQLNEYRTITMHLHADTSINLGDTLHSFWTIQPLTNDVAPTNNMYAHHQACLSSFDPNGKTVTPDGNILSTQELEYTIHFQNTGTAPAFNVFLQDDLDANADVSTFKLVGFSHPVTYAINGTGHVVFTFMGINLPDSVSNEQASHGSVTYHIMPKSGLAAGSKIHNTASIIFDYNSPVVTNTTENIIIENIPNAVDNLTVEDNSILIYPNPSKNFITIASANVFKNATVVLTDMTGKVVLKKQFNHTTTTQLNLSDLHKGIYLLEIADAGKVTRKKVVKQ